MNVVSVCFEAPSFQLEAASFHLTKTSLPYLWQTEVIVKYQFHTVSSAEREPCENGLEREWKTEQRDSWSSQTSNLMGWDGLCNVHSMSRAALHIRACLHSVGPLQSLTAGKTSSLLWAQSQEKAALASLSQRGRYSDRFSPTTAERNNRLVMEKFKLTEDDRRQIVGQKR